MKYITWDKLKIYGKNKFVLSTSIFMFLTPIFYKLKVFIEDSVSIYLKTSLVIDFPFTWQLLFVASILFSLGTLLFRLFCPDLIFSYSNLGEYTKAGNYISQLRSYLNEVVKFEYLEQYVDGEIIRTNKYKGNLPNNFKFKRPISDRLKFDSAFSMYSGFHHQKRLQFTRVDNDLEKTQMKRLFVDLHFKNLFYEIYDYSKSVKTNIRILIAIIYTIGTILVGITIVENIAFVVTQFMK